MCTVANGRKETSLRHRLVTYEGFVGVLSKSGMCRNCKFPRCSWNKYLNVLTLARNNEKIQPNRGRGKASGQSLKLQDGKCLKWNAQCRVTWDQALFSFRFENYILEGKAKRKESLIQTFNEMSAAHFFDWLTFAESANQNYFCCLFF